MTTKAEQAKHDDALAAQAAVNDPSVVPAEDKNVEVQFQDLETATEQGYLGESPARAAAGGKADKGLSQQSILKG